MPELCALCGRGEPLLLHPPPNSRKHTPSAGPIHFASAGPELVKEHDSLHVHVYAVGVSLSERPTYVHAVNRDSFVKARKVLKLEIC